MTEGIQPPQETPSQHSKITPEVEARYSRDALPVVPVQLDNPEQQSFREHLQRILTHMSDWRNASERYTTSTGNERWTARNGSFDVVRQEGVTRARDSDNEVADSPNTDTYRMLLNFVDDKRAGSQQMFSLMHFTGEQFLHDPQTGEPIQNLQFQLQEFPQPDSSNNYRLALTESTANSTEYQIVYTLENGKLYVDPQAALHYRPNAINEEHAEKLAGLVDTIMPRNDLGQPNEVKQIT